MQKAHAPSVRNSGGISGRSGRFNTVRDTVDTADLPRYIESWLLAGDISRHSERTIASRRERLGRLVWFLQEKKLETCGLQEIRAFFSYMNHAHKDPAGRWGKPDLRKPASSGYSKSMHSSFRTFFRWLVSEGDLDASPMERIPPPVDRPDQIVPFTESQIKALISAARKSRGDAARDEAVISVLVDTGIRSSELCSLRVGDVSWTKSEITIREGKGGKSRNVPFSSDTKKALYRCLGDRLQNADEPLFRSQRGKCADDPLLTNGLRQLIIRLAKAAQIQGVRCSPHTFRHTFAVMFLRSGGNVFTLRVMLGHETLAMTNRYVALAEADVNNQHRMYSPLARVNGKIR